MIRKSSKDAVFLDWVDFCRVVMLFQEESICGFCDIDKCKEERWLFVWLGFECFRDGIDQLFEFCCTCGNCVVDA